MAKYRCTVCNWVYDEEKEERNLLIYLKSGFAQFVEHQNQLLLCWQSRLKKRSLQRKKLNTLFQMF